MAQFDQLLQDVGSSDYFNTMLPFLALIVAVLIVVAVLIYFMYKRRKEFDYKPGIKAGLIAYAITSVVHVIFLNLSISGTSAVIDYGYVLVNELTGIIIAGLFWGAVFVFFYNKLPGSSGIFKAFVLGLIPFILPTIIGIAFFFDSYALIETIVQYVIFGIFLGYFYERFKKPQPNSAASQGKL